ncbi:hypothetical protein RH858_08340 [Halalkaliarchaeum sp. AArc-GB]|uniref:hypothetical protein n=1 Tax=Halalkaliarchaeum sp. AArc-GB TaxID=3074078 RepID=UPI0028548140|nr:hypothetical protein [Halalkaliarchaeum sp. AArc-GB]MDR5673157.1 hypothetical protein [Halalkaliarchaeum sp. AArc-GB]
MSIAEETAVPNDLKGGLQIRDNAVRSSGTLCLKECERFGTQLFEQWLFVIDPTCGYHPAVLTVVSLYVFRCVEGSRF